MLSAVTVPVRMERLRLPTSTWRPRASLAVASSLGRKLFTLMKNGIAIRITTMTATAIAAILRRRFMMLLLSEAVRGIPRIRSTREPRCQMVRTESLSKNKAQYRHSRVNSGLGTEPPSNSFCRWSRLALLIRTEVSSSFLPSAVRPCRSRIWPRR